MEINKPFPADNNKPSSDERSLVISPDGIGWYPNYWGPPIPPVPPFPPIPPVYPGYLPGIYFPFRPRRPYVSTLPGGWLRDQGPMPPMDKQMY